MPSGDRILGNCDVRDYAMRISKIIWLSNLIIVDIKDKDLILCDHWLDRHGEIIDYRTRFISILAEDGTKYSFVGYKQRGQKLIISIMKSTKLCKKDCIGYRCYAMKVEDEEFELSSIPVLHDYLDIFPDNMPGLPSGCEVKFAIYLKSDATSISKAPYCMEPLEMQDLKIQLGELLEKVDVGPSASPYP